MVSARRLYRLQLGLGALGLGATVLALAVALSRVDFRVASFEALGDACRQMGLTDFSASALYVLLLGSLAVAVVALVTRSAVSQLRSRRFLASLSVIGRAAVEGHETLVIADPVPKAFCTGLLRPRIYVSCGALDLLDRSQLRAVVYHEAHHVRRRDPLRIFVARALGEALFFLPVLRRLEQRYTALAELAADEAAVRQSGTRRPLAAALLAFEEAPSTGVVGIGPERVDHLLGERARWQMPIALFVGGAVTLAGLFAVVARTVEATGKASIDMPLLLAQACMVAMAVLPVLAGAAALLGYKRALGPRGR